MKFTKMHGIGNDYVYVNCFKETVNNPSAVAKFVSDRHFGIGSDGLILIKPSDVADCEMDMLPSMLMITASSTRPASLLQPRAVSSIWI